MPNKRPRYSSSPPGRNGRSSPRPSRPPPGKFADDPPAASNTRVAAHEPAFGKASLRKLLERVSTGDLPIDDALEHLKDFPFEETECATIDHHRTLRKGFSEVIYCAGKTPEQVAAIAEKLAQKSPRILGTRATLEHYAAAHAKVEDLRYDELARVLWLDRDPAPKAPGVVVIAAGTSDLAVAEEAAITLEVMGHQPVRIRDVGVAGLQRLLKHLPTLLKARVVIAVAGMEGAMPSVIAGLVPAPVIAVPTSVGYGASFGGLAALLGMLNSCASGLAVVNIDNGFGAGYMAAMINRQCAVAREEKPRSAKSRPMAMEVNEEEGGE
jgi:NCAIR mutase (PurE)-related protein